MAFSLCVGAAAVAACSQAHAATFDFSIPAQPAPQGVAAFAQQSGVQILLSAQDAEGRRTAAVRGAYSVEEGLSRLLARSGLAAQMVGPQTYALRAVRPAAARRGDRPPPEAGPLRTDPLQAPTPAVATPRPAVGLEEVVVTAQKRQERLQDVPISITANTGGMLEARGIYTTQQLQQVTPGLVYRRTSANSQFFLRGVGSYNTSIGDESPSAFYVDGIYIPNLAATIFAMNNIERVEVLRGPQGTLFGRNAAGGVIQIITRDPAREPSGRVTAGYGSYGRSRFSGYATTNVTDHVAADIAVLAEHQAEGLGRNLTTGRKAYFENNLGLRSTWLYERGETRLRLSADFNRFEADFGGRSIPAPGYVGLAGDAFAGRYTTYADLTETSVTRQGGVSLRLDQDLGWAQLVSLSSWRRVNARQPIDQDALSPVFGTARIFGHETTRTQEIQLLSHRDRPFSWVAGLYYFSDDADYDPLIVTSEVQAVTVPVFIPGIGQTVQAPIGIRLVPPITTTILSRLKTRSYAAFGQASVALTDRLSLTGGLRYTSDRRAVSGNVNGAPDTHQAARFGKLTYKLTGEYRFAADVMGYVQMSRGFKSGVFNIVSPTSAPVRPSTVDALEAGFKAQGLDNRLRLNAAAFHYRLKDVQTVQIVFGNQMLLNAARARTRGFEVELEANPVSRLSVRLGAAYLDARFTSFPNAPLYVENPLPNPFGGPSGFVTYVGDASGAIMPSAPKWELQAGADYGIETRAGLISLAMNAAYTDRIYAQDNKFSTPAYVLVNASATWTSKSGRWSVKGLARNLLNERYLVQRSPSISPASVNQLSGEPRTLELQLGVHW